MSLKLIKGRNGKLRKTWHGKVTVDGKTKVVNLGVPIRGTIPSSLRKLGDPQFEKSRGIAQEKLNQFTQNASDKRQAQRTLETLYEIQSGQKVEYVKLSELKERWRSRPGISVTEGYLKGCDAIFKRFEAFCKKFHPGVESLHQVTQPIAEEYAQFLSEKLAPKTVRSHIVILKGAHEKFSQFANNPFKTIKTKVPDNQQIHRKALTVEELARLIEVAEQFDPELVDGIRCCAYTGLRKGDAVKLLWESVEETCLRVQTSKTGAEVVIPIFPPMREVLDRNRDNDSEFVFPKLASIHETDPSELTKRFKKLALLMDPDAQSLPVKPDNEVLREGLKYIKESIPLSRRDRVRDNFMRYMAGDSYVDISNETGRHKSAISYDLNSVQEGIGCRVIRRKNGETIRNNLQRTRKTRKQGVRSGSKVDWHCLRTTFASIALENGMSEGNLLSITGHTSMQTVIKHYRQIKEKERNREYEKMPAFFTGSDT
jgi:integrase